VFVNPSEGKEDVIINDADELKRFHNKNKHDVFVGFNSQHYDSYIFKAILCGFNPKKVSDFIVSENNPGWRYSKAFYNVKLNNYDVKNNFNHSLKELEGFMGNDIMETSVPFDIGHPLTREEIDETVKYCRHDVEQTVEVFLRSREEFDAHMGLVRLASEGGALDLSLINKTNPQLAALILNASKRKYNDEFDFDLPPTARIEKYTQVSDWYNTPENRRYNNQLNVKIAGVPHQFGYGGLHGAITKYHGKGYFINMDVTSLYPSLMIKYNLISRSMKNPTRFEEIYNTRLRYKREGNALQAALKLVLNSTYGVMKAPGNALYDPRQANAVCVYGQILLLDLIERLESHCELIQSNTDGVLIRMPAGREPDEWYSTIDDAAYEWEKRTNLTLEFEEFVEVWQKDVNNYILIAADGKYKSKGAYVKKLSPLDYNLPIVNYALVEYMTRGVSVERTIGDCDELKMFQQIVKIGDKYKYIMHGNKPLKEKCIRIFASGDWRDAGIGKLHRMKKTPDKIPNSPPRCFIYNENIHAVRVPDKLDKDWYIDLANKRLGDFGIINQAQYTIAEWMN
jgi:DNA polymerase